MSIAGRPPRLLFIDSGVGGLTVLASTRQAIPEAEICFIADDAGFPYGSKSDAELVAGLHAIIARALNEFAADCVVIACNTASTVALQALRETFPLPLVGTVPAIKPAAALTASGLVSVLATPATVAKEYTRVLVERFGRGAHFTLIGSSELAAIAEAHASGVSTDDDAIRREIAPCFVEKGSLRTDVIVLGCTHYPLLMEKFDTLSPWPVAWLDPAPAVARRIANVLAERGHFVGVGARRGLSTIHFTSGRTPSSALLALLRSHRLDLAPLAAAIAV
jgi:glutamate racemase